MKEFLYNFALSATDAGIPSSSETDVLASGLAIVYWIVGVVAVITITLAGFMYVTSGGDPNKATKAKNMILYSVIGLIVVILAFVVTQFVIGRF